MTNKILVSEEIRKYDENNNCIYSKGFNGLECWREYNEKGKVVRITNSDGAEETVNYYDDGYTHILNIDGYIIEFHYNNNGNLIHYKNISTGEEYWCEYEYDSNNNLTSIRKYANGVL